MGLDNFYCLSEMHGENDKNSASVRALAPIYILAMLRPLLFAGGLSARGILNDSFGTLLFYDTD